ncbi:DUF1294 domain-containing protein [uncultured Shewanella sp.]|uniref:DUF1294 domain-containing protein n=1 Tax=Shewanella atlantica TaxID=271099 RepID=UPI002615DB3C|nr:DUF1294 domain-containing protein [uncultured Shewanella sp.]
MRITGKLTQWNDDRGFGFITLTGGQERIFIHIKAFGHRDRRPELNDIISFIRSKDKQGRDCAVQACLAGEKMRPKLIKPSRHKSALGPLLILALAGLITIALFQQMLPYQIAPFYLVVSTFTFLAYGLDKSAARRGCWRTRESTLQLMALIGGWPGALLAQRWLRHKSQKTSFRLMLWLMIAMNTSSLLWLLSATGQALLQQLELI